MFLKIELMQTLTLVIPVYNEARRVTRAFYSLEKYQAPKGIMLTHVVFVNDGSYDETLSVLKSWKSKKYTVKIISYAKNRGRGYAVRRGLRGITTDYAVYVDADMSIPLSNLVKFEKFMKAEYDVIFGSKKAPGAQAKPKRALIRQIIGYGHSFLAVPLLGIFAWDFQGGFKMFSRKFIDQVLPMANQERWGFDMESIFLGKKLGYKVSEVPVFWSYKDRETRVQILRDIRRAIFDMVKIRTRWELELKDKKTSFGVGTITPAKQPSFVN